jgi:hypothetical protein
MQVTCVNSLKFFALKVVNSLLQKLTEESTKKSGQLEEMELEHRTATEKLNENSQQLRSLKEEQKVKLGKLEKELRKVKNQVKQLETRCASAEADAKSKSASLTEVHLATAIK